MKKSKTPVVQVPGVPAEIWAIFGAPPILSTEDPKAYWLLFAGIAEDIQPSTTTMWLLVKDLTDITWEIRRLRLIEMYLIEQTRDAQGTTRPPDPGRHPAARAMDWWNMTVEEGVVNQRIRLLEQLKDLPQEEQKEAIEKLQKSEQAAFQKKQEKFEELYPKVESPRNATGPQSARKTLQALQRGWRTSIDRPKSTNALANSKRGGPTFIDRSSCSNSPARFNSDQGTSLMPSSETPRRC
jgi:hypothetical protein